MPRAPRKTAVLTDATTAAGVLVNGVPATMPQDDEEAEEQHWAGRLQAVLGSGADNVRVSLFRVDRFNAKKIAFITEYPPSEFLEGGFNLVAERHGPGTYEWRAYSRGTGGVLGSDRIVIADEGAQRNPEPATGAVAGSQDASASVAAAMASVLAPILQGMQAAIERMSTAPPAPPPVDPFTMFEKLAGVMRAMQPPPAPAPAPAPDPVSTIKQLAETIQVLKGVASETAGDNEPADPLLTLAKPLLEMVAESRRPGAASPEAGAVQPVALPASLANVPATVPPTVPEPDDETSMRELLAELTRRAVAGSDPAEAGELLHAYLPESAVPFLKMPGWFDMLATYAPELAPHRAWVEKVKAEADKRFAASP